MDRRKFISGLMGTAAAVGGASLLSACGKGGGSGSGAGGVADTLRIIQTSSLISLDPIWTTAPGTRDMGLLVFDQLIAPNSRFEMRPQMLEKWAVEDGGKAYLMTLRAGLKFHDGTPVRPADCIASITRWAARDGFGGILMKQIEAMEPVDDKQFRIRLKRPFPLLPEAIGKCSAPACLIMPERLAKTDPHTQVTEAIGSGPYRFVKEEWVPGSHATFARFDDYVPRNEPTDALAGGRHAGAKRLELTQIADPSTALAALQAGEQDYWDVPPADLLATLRADPNIIVESRWKLPSSYMLQVNHLQPPFNNLAVRQAMAMAIDQRQVLRTVVDDPKLLQPCYSVYPCGSLYASEVGADALKVASIDKAKAALAASGYRGEKVVLLGNSEGPFAGVGTIVEDIMRRIGLNVQLVALDFASITQRRTNRGAVDKGGWSAFLTGWTGADILNPVVHPMLRGAGAAGYPGWADDPLIEQLRSDWALATDAADQMRIAHALQEQAFKTFPYIPLGSVFTRSAFRKSVTGIFSAPVTAYFNLGKQT